MIKCNLSFVIVNNNSIQLVMMNVFLLPKYFKLCQKGFPKKQYIFLDAEINQKKFEN